MQFQWQLTLHTDVAVAANQSGAQRIQPTYTVQKLASIGEGKQHREQIATS